MPDIRVGIQMDANGTVNLRQMDQDLSAVRDKLMSLGATARSTSGNFRILELEMNRVLNTMNGRFSSGLGTINRYVSDLTGNLMGLARFGIGALVGELTVATYGLAKLGKSFIEVNENFANLEITLKSTFRSALIARDLRNEIAKITSYSPIPFQDLGNVARSFATMPQTRGQIVSQSINGTISDPNGFFRSSERLVEQMLAFRPDKKAEDAIFSIREALSGEFRSLVRRFDIPIYYLTSLSGKSSAQLKTDPDETLRAMKALFSKIITPEAIQEYSRQPRVQLQNLKENAFDLPALLTGDKGFYAAFVSKIGIIFNEANTFVKKMLEGKLDPLLQHMSDSLTRAMNMLAGVGAKTAEFVLGKVGLGAAANPSMSLPERIAVGITQSIETLTTKLPQWADRAGEFFKKLLPILEAFAKIVTSIVGFSVDHPIEATLLYSAKGAVGGYLSSSIANAVKQGQVSAASEIASANFRSIIPNPERVYAPSGRNLNSMLAMTGTGSGFLTAGALSTLSAEERAALGITGNGIRPSISSDIVDRMKRAELEDTIGRNPAQYYKPSGRDIRDLYDVAGSGNGFLKKGMLATLTAEEQAALGILGHTSIRPTIPQSAIQRAETAAGMVPYSAAGAVGAGLMQGGKALLSSLGIPLLIVTAFEAAQKGAESLGDAMDRATSRTLGYVQAASADPYDTKKQGILQLGKDIEALKLEAKGLSPGFVHLPQYKVDPASLPRDTGSNPGAMMTDWALKLVSPLTSTFSARTGTSKLIEDLAATEKNLVPLDRAFVELSRLNDDVAKLKAYQEDPKRNGFTSQTTRFQFGTIMGHSEEVNQAGMLTSMLSSWQDVMRKYATERMEQRGVHTDVEMTEGQRGAMYNATTDILKVLNLKSRFDDPTNKDAANSRFAQILKSFSAIQNAEGLNRVEEAQKRLETERDAIDPFHEVRKTYDTLDSREASNNNLSRSITDFMHDGGRGDFSTTRSVSDTTIENLITKLNSNKLIQKTGSPFKIGDQEYTYDQLIDRLREAARNTPKEVFGLLKEALGSIESANKNIDEARTTADFDLLANKVIPSLLKSSSPAESKLLIERAKERFGPDIINLLPKIAGNPELTGVAAERQKAEQQFARSKALGLFSNSTNEGQQAKDAAYLAEEEGKDINTKINAAQAKILSDRLTSAVPQILSEIESINTKSLKAGRGLADDDLGVKKIDDLVSGLRSLGLAQQAVNVEDMRGTLLLNTDGAENVGNLIKKLQAVNPLLLHMANAEKTLAQNALTQKNSEGIVSPDSAEFIKHNDASNSYLRLRDTNIAKVRDIKGDGFFSSMREGFTSLTEEWKATATNMKSVGSDLASGLNNSLGGSLSGFIMGTKDAKAAWHDFELSFVQDAVNALTHKAVQSLLGYAFSFLTPSASSTGIGALNGGISGVSSAPLASLSSPGTFASGGPLVGGSGVRDDIPIMAMGGEYVLNRMAVKKLGLGSLNHMNRTGELPSRYADGGYVGDSSNGNAPTRASSAAPYIHVETHYHAATGATSTKVTSSQDQKGQMAEMAKQLEAVTKETVLKMMRNGGEIYRRYG